MQDLLPILVMLLVPAIAFVLVGRLRARKTPRQLRQMDSWVTMLLPLPFCLLVAMQVIQHRVTAGTMISAGSIVVLVLTRLFRSQEPFRLDEAVANYTKDTTRCGRCDYDLTGNVSGVCPECGWQIPGKVAAIADVPWTCWWKRWRIEHLDDWRKQRNQLVFFACIFGGLTVLAAIARSALGIGMAGIGFVVLAINAGRAAAYGRRQRQDRND